MGLTFEKFILKHNNIQEKNMQTLFMRRKESNVEQAKYNLRLDKALLENFSAKARKKNKSVNLYLNELIMKDLDRR